MAEFFWRLPYPPTINHYYGHRAIGKRVQVYIKARGKAYREEVFHIVKGETIGDSLCSVRIVIVPGDKRKRDLDNVQKCLLDAIAKAGVMDDDCQIMRLETVKAAPVKDNAHCTVWLNTIEDGEAIDPMTGNPYQ